MKMAILFKQYNPLTENHYINLTGEDSGFWFDVGRLGGMSSIVQGFVNTTSVLETAPLGFCNFIPQHTNSHRFVSCYMYIGGKLEPQRKNLFAVYMAYTSQKLSPEISRFSTNTTYTCFLFRIFGFFFQPF